MKYYIVECRYYNQKFLVKAESPIKAIRKARVVLIRWTKQTTWEFTDFDVYDIQERMLDDEVCAI